MDDSFSTVFQSYLFDGRVIMKGFVHANTVEVHKESPHKQGFELVIQTQK